MYDSDITGMMNRACIYNGIQPYVFGSCNDRFCPKNVQCKRTGLPRTRYNVVFVDSRRCRKHNYLYFVHITSEDTGARTGDGK